MHGQFSGLAPSEAVPSDWGGGPTRGPDEHPLDERVNHGAFVDDIALYIVMLAGLQALPDDLNHQLALCGLEISTKPSGGRGTNSSSFF